MANLAPRLRISNPAITEARASLQYVSNVAFNIGLLGTELRPQPLPDHVAQLRRYIRAMTDRFEPEPGAVVPMLPDIAAFLRNVSNQLTGVIQWYMTLPVAQPLLTHITTEANGPTPVDDMAWIVVPDAIVHMDLYMLRPLAQGITLLRNSNNPEVKQRFLELFGARYNPTQSRQAVSLCTYVCQAFLDAWASVIDESIEQPLPSARAGKAVRTRKRRSRASRRRSKRTSSKRKLTPRKRASSRRT